MGPYSVFELLRPRQGKSWLATGPSRAKPEAPKKEKLEDVQTQC